MIKHTDLPWHIEPHGFGGYYIMRENGDTVATKAVTRRRDD